MRNAHILNYVTGTAWALHEDKLLEVIGFLQAHSNGYLVSAEAIEAFAGRQAPAPSTASGSVAIIPVRGVIAHRASMLEESSGGVSTETLAKTYRQVMADPNVSAVVLDFDSPGGAVAGIHELATEMLALKGTKRVVAVANSFMASAAYWLAAAAADEIVAMPSAVIGSLGVAAVRKYETEEGLKQKGIGLEIYTSAENKAEALGVGPSSDAGKARRQAMVDEAGSWFRSDVAKGRGVSVADVRAKFGEGAVFGAKDAKAAGLIDRIGTMDETIGRLVGRKAQGAGLRAEELTPEQIAAAEAVDEAVGTPFETTIAGTFEADRLRRLERF